MAIQNNLTSSSIRKYLPSKVISGVVTDIFALESWLYDDGYGDPWWQGSTGAPCRWTITADVYSATHSSHLTRVPQIYNALDLVPGMWVFGDGEAKALKIVSILSVTDSQIQCVVEDVDRYNTFADPAQTGVGIFSPGRNLIFFELGDDGLPILNPLPANTDIASVSQVEARFRVFNPVVENRFFQVNHGFKEGQVLKLDPTTGMFVQANSNDLYVVGTVTAVGPGPNYFYLAPSTKIITNLEPGLPGSAGDVIWLDATTGDRTTEQTGSLAPLYVKMTNEVTCFTIGTVANPTTWDGTTIKLNNHTITFSDVGGPVSTVDILSTINSYTTNTGVIASMGSPATMVVGGTQYPTNTPTSDMEFEVNGVPITVAQSPSVNFGTGGDIGWWDVIRAINEQTFNHGVYASFDTNTGYVNFRNDAGGDITFTNVTPSTTTGSFKTLTDMLGVSASNPAASADFVQLVRSDGGQITITDVIGSFTADTGLKSAANGSLPLGLVVDKTMNANSNYMVVDIVARDALTNLKSGDQVFVQSADDGEWALFVRVGSSWTKIADYDSAKTDADTLEITITPESDSVITLGTVSSDSRIVNVTVVVSEAFDGTNPVITIGTTLDSSAITGSGNNDLTAVGSYETSTSYTYSGAGEGDIVVYFTSGSSSTGVAKVIVSYL